MPLGYADTCYVQVRYSNAIIANARKMDLVSQAQLQVASDGKS